MTFGETLRKLRTAAGKSRYRLAQYSGISGINEAYILRLERGERSNPSRDVVLMLGLALVESSESSVGIWDIDELLLSAGYAPLRRRGNIGVAAT
jgi:transcriptional regulator with XRE-family HTH domain